MKPFENAGGYTIFRNAILDYIMPDCSPNTWKIVCAVMRQTRGWQKEDDWLSINMFMKLTGIKNRRTCTKAIAEALDCKYIMRKPYRNGYKYALNTQYEVVIELDSAETVPSNSTETVLPNGTEIVPTKEIVKETNTKESNNKIPVDVIRAYVYVLGEVTGLDTKLNYGKIAKEAKILHEAGYTSEVIAKTYQANGVWYKKDWRGKKGQKPGLYHIRQTIKELSSVRKPEQKDYLGKYAEFIES